jgi:glycerol-3-phosphate dehydrogenase
VAGGKLTTHRRIARRVLREVTRGNWQFTDDPLPGARSRLHRAAPPEVAPDVWAHLTHLYGDEAPMVLEAGGVERVHPDGPDIWAQVEYAIDREWARTVEDVVRRRTTLTIRGMASEAVRREVARQLARRGIDSADRLGAAR